MRTLRVADYTALYDYLKCLSKRTKDRFGPHPFDLKTIIQICSREFLDYIPYGCFNVHELIAYAVVKPGYVESDLKRYESYGIGLDAEYSYTLAPSVADHYQSKGIGSKLYENAEQDLKAKGAKRVVLWGGVQSDNKRAVNFYTKFGFKEHGEFKRAGVDNLDMSKDLTRDK